MELSFQLTKKHYNLGSSQCMAWLQTIRDRTRPVTLKDSSQRAVENPIYTNVSCCLDVSDRGLGRSRKHIPCASRPTSTMPVSYSMNGGEGAHSYALNSAYQRGAVEAAEQLIKQEIAKLLDIERICRNNTTQTIRIADFGCSTGPNTFLAVQNIIDAIIQKFETEGLINTGSPDFQVFFNDNVSNDFNTLFASLPPERQFYVAGVPGSFYTRSFPNSFLHFAHSSSALCWLSELPKEITEEYSPAYNKGKIHYAGARQQVFDAYAAQFGKDFQTFLNARSEELVSGGLMALLVPGVPNHLHPTHTTTGTEMGLLGSCLMDMAVAGHIDEAMVDTFNLPIYYTFPNEVKALVERNKRFSIERMETLNNSGKHISMPDPKSRALYLRAALEGVLAKHFGTQIMDELFTRYAAKIQVSSFFLDPSVQKSIFIFLLLKRIE